MQVGNAWTRVTQAMGGRHTAPEPREGLGRGRAAVTNDTEGTVNGVAMVAEG